VAARSAATHLFGFDLSQAKLTLLWFPKKNLSLIDELDKLTHAKDAEV
jgi:hypothetical protein